MQFVSYTVDKKLYKSIFVLVTIKLQQSLSNMYSLTCDDTRMIILVFIFCMLNGSVQGAEDKCSRNNMYFTKSANKKLNVTPENIISVETVNYTEKCLAVCRRNSSCMSFNAVKIKNNKVKCELINGTQATILPQAYLADNVTSSYFQSNICRYTNEDKLTSARDRLDLYHQGHRKDGIVDLYHQGHRKDGIVDLYHQGHRKDGIVDLYHQGHRKDGIVSK